MYIYICRDGHARSMSTRDFVDGNVPPSVASDVIRLSQKLNVQRAAYISAYKRTGIRYDV